jgi:hypothetical protein
VNTRYTNLGRMASEVGWKHWDAVKTLEEKRKTKGAAYWAKKKELIQARSSPTTLLRCFRLPRFSVRGRYTVCAVPGWTANCIPFGQMRTKAMKAAAGDKKVAKVQKILDAVEKPSA